MSSRAAFTNYDAGVPPASFCVSGSQDLLMTRTLSPGALSPRSMWTAASAAPAALFKPASRKVATLARVAIWEVDQWAPAGLRATRKLRGFGRYRPRIRRSRSNRPSRPALCHRKATNRRSFPSLTLILPVEFEGPTLPFTRTFQILRPLFSTNYRHCPPNSRNPSSIL
jgi:hypothetical protein